MPRYSKRSLIDKVGIKEGDEILVLHAPNPYVELVGDLPGSVKIRETGDGPFDVILFFTKSREELERYLPDLKARLKQSGMLWVSWIKGSSGVVTDLNEHLVIQIGLRNDLVDVKVIGIDEMWSGLKFVYSIKDRPYTQRAQG